MSRSDGTADQPSGNSAAAPDEDRSARLGWRGLGPGLLLIAIGCLALYAGRDLSYLSYSSGSAFGAGVLPRILSSLLIGLGVLVAVEDFFHRPSGISGSIVPVIVLAVAGTAFLLAAGSLGLVAATGLAVAIVAGYGLHTRPIAFALVVAASTAVALLLNLAEQYLSGGA